MKRAPAGALFIRECVNVVNVEDDNANPKSIPVLVLCIASALIRIDGNRDFHDIHVFTIFSDS
jgi:hypothetical protein